jgi:hypothetical protein
MKALTLFILITLSSVVDGQWSKVTEIPETSSVPSFFIEDDNIYAGANGMIYISTDGGESWNGSNRISTEVDFVSALTKYDNRIFAGAYNYGVFESTDNGTTWFPRNIGLIGPGAKTISDFVIRENKLYASTIGSGIFVFDLFTGNNWQPFNNGIPSNLANNVNSITLKDGIIYAGAGGNGYYYTNQPGSDEWTEHQFGEIISEPLTFFDILILGQHQFILSSYGLYKSTDSGNSWYFINTGTGYLSNGNFINTGTDFFVAMTKSSRTIWLKSSDNGITWNLWNEVIGAITLNAVYTNGKIFDGRLYGLWYYQLVPDNVDDEDNGPEDFILNQNFPNPFNPVTNITFSVLSIKNDHIILKVYDSLGREVVTLINEERPVGKYEIEFDASNLSSGVYYYSLSTGNVSSTKKMTLVR